MEVAGVEVAAQGLRAKVSKQRMLTALAPDRLLAAADAALYRAKRAGKGRVELVVVGADR